MKPTKDANREDNIVSLAGHKKEKLHALNKEMYGEVIRTWRQYRGISQTRLTEALGLSRNLVSNWEAGRSRPDINIIPALCQALDISISAFFGIPGRPGELTVPEQRHISYYRMLNSDNQELVDAIIGNMLDQAARELRKRCERGFERTFKNAQLTAAGTGNPPGRKPVRSLCVCSLRPQLLQGGRNHHRHRQQHGAHVSRWRRFVH